MSMTVTFLALFSRLPLDILGIRSCVPNSTFLTNGALCYCDSVGRWTEGDCRVVARRQTCSPGHISWQGCTQCICQQNGQLSCTDVGCTDTPLELHTKSKGLFVVGSWCTPFTTYYVDFSVCVCPATGRTAEAHCVTDTDYTFKGTPTIEELTSKKTPGCLPKVMYLFPCLHCFCSDQGAFTKAKCVETCQNGKPVAVQNHCVARSLYRKDCNICKCPEDGIPNDDGCTNKSCSKAMIQTLPNLRSEQHDCQPNSFTKMRCMYCDCQQNGTVNGNSCVEQDCLKDVVVEYGIHRNTCSPNEVVPICIECFCLRNGTTNDFYCTQTCSYQSKITVLEKLIRDSDTDVELLKSHDIEKKSSKDLCDPDSIYIDDGRYCLCPEHGETNFKLCTSKIEESVAQRKIKENSDRLIINEGHHIDFNVTCEPSTFVEFDCNTCYCTKGGKIDPKWCSYDNCKSKKNVTKAQSDKSLSDIARLKDSCEPGTISKQDCNFCICPDNGKLQDRVCTKTVCTTIDQPSTDKLDCDPLAYYEADCNICVCPGDGLKNVRKCTKNLCEKSYLRTDTCIPGELFSDECNVCICPANGDKHDRACTNHTCPDATFAWRSIYKLSRTLIGAQSAVDYTRNLETCYPGEHFEDGCNRCVCPDSGIRGYATCTTAPCEDEQKLNKLLGEYRGSQDKHRSRRTVAVEEVEIDEDAEELEEGCVAYNLTRNEEAMDCTVGSMYIIRCKQCLCPYMDNIHNFCRPLPKNVYCEQAFPGFNYLVNNFRRDTVNSTSSKNDTKHDGSITHKHTKHSCAHPGKVMDDCFICECEEDNKLIEEHCFRNQSTACEEARPSFLFGRNKVLVL